MTILTFRKIDWNYTCVKLCSGGEEDSLHSCHLRVCLFNYEVELKLPRLIRPTKVWVDTSQYSWSANPAGGYWQTWGKEYGFSCHEGHFSLYYGKQTHDSSTDKRKGYFLPWAQWRFIRHEIFDGQMVSFARSNGRGSMWDQQQAVPKVRFNLNDYDGEAIIATCYVSEREWAFGDGWFKWLSWFRKNLIRRELEISFDKEVGMDKGTYKGGVVGTGIEMLKGESPEEALVRFCALNHRAKYGKTYKVTLCSN